MTGSLSIDRTSLSLDPLAVTGSDPAGTGLWIPQAGVVRPGISTDTAFISAPDYDGDRAVRTRKTNQSWPWAILAAGDSTADVEALLDELEDAVTTQLVYTVTHTVDGVAKEWTCYPAASVDYGASYDLSFVAAFVRAVSVTIPVYPTPVAV